MKNSLKNRKDIDKLFSSLAKNKTISDFIIKIVEGVPGYLVCVSSKTFKRAVDRNRIKRMIREELKGLTPNKSFGIIYIGKNVPSKINLRKHLV